ncbi:zinc-binding metallopeptidase family protein [Sphingomonas quercus]|uniref:Zinc-binding peptidase n=1 Tax=Sphingomonas quercus TaxID=2842451 RepID=A0ABS6BI79_9SPHN|nr:putative zinc-binding metallopeptidase [Sphingomonas quercus]MBU3078013.1 putative zinc-binding peptidase [Sphingomonas quercus]
MAVFPCPFCRQLLQFEARTCQSCGHAVAYRPDADAFLFLDTEAGLWRGPDGNGLALRPCANARYGACNWLVERDATEDRCRACRHNRIIPDLAVPGVLERWRKIEEAKRRLIRTLIRLGLPLENRVERPADGLGFAFLYDRSAEQGRPPVLPTGHQGGIVTLNLIEADDVARERIRREMGEPYRTLLGHFRHEVGHHYWSRLIERGPMLEGFRALFGDERQDYRAALSAHHARHRGAGAATASETHVSDYATAHPWEDFAETFAHFLHIVDTLATLGEFGMGMDEPGLGEPAVDFDPYRAQTAVLAGRWIPFAFALNAINRSMGQPDLYPFRLTPGVVVKLDFVNRMCAAARGEPWPEEASLAAMIATLGHAVEMPAD